MTDRLSASVDAEDIRRLVDTYAERAHDLVLLAGCPEDDACQVLLSALGQMLDVLMQSETAHEDLLGQWLREVSDLGQLTATLPVRNSFDDVDPITARISAALAALEPQSRLLLRLRDTYDLPPGSVAVALGIDIPELRRRTGTARLAFLGQYDPAADQLLLALPSCAADLGQLAAFCDSTAPPGIGAEVRRHAYHCSRCEETAEAQRRSRRILSRVAVRPLTSATRFALVAEAGQLAENRLPVLAGMLRGGSAEPTRRRRSPHPAVVGAALCAALTTGVVAGVAAGRTSPGPSGSQPETVSVPGSPDRPVVAGFPTLKPATAR